jgi:HNH endonuclease
MTNGERYKDRLSKNLCGGCGKTPVKGRKMCRKCKADAANDRRTKIKKGQCVRCTQKAEGGLLVCQNCRDKQRQTANANTANRHRKFFMYAVHQVKATRGGRRRGGGTTTAIDLVRLWRRQRGLCAFTGRLLTRYNAELDHILPQSRGGDNEVDNLQWTIKEANRAKQGLTDKEFIILCQEIVDYRKGD